MGRGTENTIHAQSESKYRKNKYPLSPQQAKWLLISSAFFLVPSVYALILLAYYHCLLSLITSVISMMYWYHAVPGWRRTLDLYCAKISFVGYVSTGFYFVTDPIIHYIGWPIGILIVYFYQQSCTSWQKDEERWIRYHMTFHALVAINQCLVICGSFHLTQ